MKTGACLCKKVKFSLKHLRDVVNCHCEECRKFHGNYAAFTKVKNEYISISGEENINWYQVKNESALRGFCKTCGSSLFWKKEKDDGICVSAGAIDTPTKLKTTKNIYVDYASDFYEMDRELETYPTTMQGRK
ncbi:MAG: GFA family protein [Proteobacteria bacterium]|nr:GFA family protein [Pseudomonadota bacterium]